MACYPSTRAGRANYTCNEELEIITNLHNQKLSDKLQELENQLEGFMYSKFDFNSEVKKRIKNPSEYGTYFVFFFHYFKFGKYYNYYCYYYLRYESWCEGLKVANTACCGSGPFRGLGNCGKGEFELCDNISDYLLFDSSHPTEVVCRQFVDMFWNGNSNVTAPYNLKALFRVKGTEIIKQIFWQSTCWWFVHQSNCFANHIV